LLKAAQMATDSTPPQHHFALKGIILGIVKQSFFQDVKVMAPMGRRRRRVDTRTTRN